MALEMRLHQIKTVQQVIGDIHVQRQVEDLVAKTALVICFILAVKECHKLLHVKRDGGMHDCKHVPRVSEDKDQQQHVACRIGDNGRSAAGARCHPAKVVQTVWHTELVQA